MLGADPGLYTDFTGLEALRARAREPEAAREVARQMEALFLQTLLKAARDAGLGDPLTGGGAVRDYQDLYDRQLALVLARGRGLGLAPLIARQLGAPEAPSPPRPVPAPAPEAPFTGPEDFGRRLAPLAREAGARLGVAPELLLAQAALETGWGRRVSRLPDGRSSHNLFNIKADGRWHGPRVEVRTLEYEEGLPRRRRARFRVYASYAESFRDYVDFLRGSPRYAAALAAGDGPRFVEALQAAGYATDPHYARKVLDVAARLPRVKLSAAGPIQEDGRPRAARGEG